MLSNYFSYDVNKYQHVCSPNIWALLAASVEGRGLCARVVHECVPVHICVCLVGLIHAYRGEYKWFVVYFTTGRCRYSIINYQKYLTATTELHYGTTSQTIGQIYKSIADGLQEPCNRNASLNACSLLQNPVSPVVISQVEVLYIYSLKL